MNRAQTAHEAEREVQDATAAHEKALQEGTTRHEVISLLQRRTMLLGTDEFPIQHSSQILREVGRKLKPTAAHC